MTFPEKTFFKFLWWRHLKKILNRVLSFFSRSNGTNQLLIYILVREKIWFLKKYENLDYFLNWNILYLNLKKKLLKQFSQHACIKIFEKKNSQISFCANSILKWTFFEFWKKVWIRFKCQRWPFCGRIKYILLYVHQ